MLFHFLSQVITLPTSIGDLAPWLLLPATLGILAPLLSNLILSIDPVKLEPFETAVRVLSYIIIAVVSVTLTKIPPEVLDQLSPWFVAIMAAVAAFLGDKVSSNVGSFLKTAAIMMGLVALRAAVGKNAATDHAVKAIKRD